ncbi:MAG: hypothetical protein R8G66_23825 [Cytophagales bacterium]|nr:hypothetical protein [Cytophagales bacterium]
MHSSILADAAQENLEVAEQRELKESQEGEALALIGKEDQDYK